MSRLVFLQLFFNIHQVMNDLSNLLPLCGVARQAIFWFVIHVPPILFYTTSFFSTAQVLVKLVGSFRAENTFVGMIREDIQLFHYSLLTFMTYNGFVYKKYILFYRNSGKKFLK
jgi:hypothetical protein